MRIRLNSLCTLLYLFTCIVATAQYTPGTTYLGSNHYIEYRAGNLPIIVSAPHGGSLEPASIPDRSCGNCVTVKDTWTEELAYEIDETIRGLFGGYPHVITNRLHRKKLDANRGITEAALGVPAAETAWHEYHDFVQAAKDSCVARFGSALYIDLHAHGHTIQRIELGYLLSKTELQLPNSVLDAQHFQDSSSIKHLHQVLNPTSSFAELLRGNDCMGELLTNHGYPSVPSASDTAPAPADPYFSGGYNTARHGSRDSSSINGIQFELNYDGIRNNGTNRRAFARALSCIVRDYLERWYFDLDTWDPGHQVTSTADSGPGSLRSALLGAEDGTVITFDTSLLGDTIRLQRELQVCSDVIIQGPGAGHLAISGENTCRILRIMEGRHVEISGLGLARGQTPAGEDGAAILAEGNIQLTNCLVTRNHADDDGGAISISGPNAAAALDSCVVNYNSCGDDGGGLRCFEGTLTINASTVAHNASPSYGGGLSSNGTVTITNSTFAYNEAAQFGGGIRNFGSGSLTCVNTTLVHNTCGDRGAGISTAAAVDLNFCTITENQAPDLGGGIRIAGSGSCAIRNTLVAGNVTGNGEPDVSIISGAFTSTGYNLIGDTTGSAWIPAQGDQLGQTSSPIDPMTLSLDSNGGPTQTVALQAGSPCIDQADTTGVPLYDQRGQLRFSGTRPDIGAVEFCLPTSSRDVQTGCYTYTWIDGITYTESNDTATFIIPNAGGCDSVITLDLTIYEVDTTVSPTGTTLFAHAIATSFQWLDCENGFSPLPNETNATFAPTETGNYAVAITQNGCVDTSACYEINLVGIEENGLGSELRVYPNPTDGQIQFDLGTSYSSVLVTVLNPKGQVSQVARFEDAHSIQFALEGSAGFYLIELRTADDEVARIRVLKR